jgi:hypothetical protein
MKLDGTNNRRWLQPVVAFEYSKPVISKTHILIPVKFCRLLEHGHTQEIEKLEPNPFDSFFNIKILHLVFYAFRLLDR